MTAQRKSEAFANYYSAKFARERKAKPSAWIIVDNPAFINGCLLKCADPRAEADAQAAQRRAQLEVVRG